MDCNRCGKQLKGKQRRWCSQYCQKLGLKSAWRKRHASEQREYAKKWRQAKHDGDKPLANPKHYREQECLNCGSKDDLQVCHIKPLDVGGTHKHIITLCRKDHHFFDTSLRGFWNEGLDMRLLASRELTYEPLED